MWLEDGFDEEVRVAPEPELVAPEDVNDVSLVLLLRSPCNRD